MDAESQALEFITPTVIEREIDGRVIVISPMSTKLMGQVLKLLQPILLSVFGVLDEPGRMDRLQEKAPSKDDLVALTQMLAEHSDRLLQVTAILARTDVAWVEDALPDRTASLLADVIVVNADFFRRALPSIMALASRAPAQNEAKEAAAPTATQAR